MGAASNQEWLIVARVQYTMNYLVLQPTAAQYVQSLFLSKALEYAPLHEVKKLF